MPTPRITMRQIRNVLRLHLEAGLTYSQIGRALDTPKSTVAKIVVLARVAGIDWGTAQGLDDTTLEARLYQPAVPRSARHLEPDFAYIHQELKRPGVTLQLLWEEVRPRQCAGVQIHELLRLIPQVGSVPEALDAPDPHRRRQTVRRLRWPDRADHRRSHRRDPRRAGLRCDIGRIELHLRLRHGTANGSGLGAFADCGAGVLRRHISADRPRPATRPDCSARPLRAGHGAAGGGVLRPLPRGGAAGAAGPPEGQAEGRERGARGRALDSCAPAQSPLL